MLRKAAAPLLIFAAFLLDTAVLPFLIHSLYIPLLSLIGVIVIGLLMGRTRGFLAGMAAGLLLDLTVSSPVGMNVLLFTAAGAIAGFAGRRFRKRMMTTVVVPLVCFVLYESVLLIYAAMAGLEVTGGTVLVTAVRCAINTVFTQILYLPYAKLLRPAWSRYTDA